MKDYIVDRLKEMGFDENKIERACNATTCESLDQVMEWIIKADLSEDDDQENIDHSMPPTPPSSQPPPSSSTSSPTGCATLKLRDQSAASSDSHSESQQSVKTPGQIEAERRKLEELIKRRRAERKEKEKKDEIEREKRRRETGSEMVKAKEQMESQERIRIAQEFRKEKLENERQRKAVLEQIRSDREAMKTRNNISMVTQSGQSRQQSTGNSSVAASSCSSASSSRSSDVCKIAIRLPNGQNLTHEFTPNEQLAAVRLYIILNRKDVPNQDPTAQSFSLILPPNRSFADDDYEKTLWDLGLCPSARLIVQNQKRFSNTGYA